MTMHRRFPDFILPALLATLLLGGCTSQVPLLIRQGPLDSPAPDDVLADIGVYAGQAVRWGGVLIATENREQVTRLTILAQHLARDGEPGTGDSSLGRFIAIVPEFLDPQVYAPDRLVTVTGTLRGSELGMIGSHPYSYPVVDAQAWYLWPEPVEPYGYPYSWWYDPWYGPWWYGSWYDPWYYPWYSPRLYPYRHPHWRRHDHPRVPPAPGTKPPPDAKPIMPTPRHRHDGPREPRQRPETGAVPHHDHNAERPRGEHTGERQRPEPRERPEAGATPPPVPGAEPPRGERAMERQQPGHARPDRDTDRQRERSVERQQERMERGMERPQAEPPRAPDTDRGFRGFFRRWRGD